MKRSFCLALLTIIAFNSLYAQQEKFTSALERAEEFLLTDNDSLLHYAKIALEIGIENNIPETSHAFAYKARAVYYQGKFMDAIQCSRRGLSWVEEHNQANTEIQAKLFNNLAANYIDIGQYQLGLDYLLEAQTIFRSLRDETQLRRNLNNIAIIWARLENYENAIGTFEELLTMELNDQVLEASIQYSLAEIYYKLNEYGKALPLAINSVEKLPEGDHRVSYSLYMLGLIQTGLEDYENALRSFNRSIQLFENKNNELNTVLPKRGLAQLFLNKKDFGSAFKEANESLEIALSHNSLPDRIASLEILAQIAEENGNFDKALEYHKTYVELSDSLQSTTIKQNIANSIAQYEFEKKERELLLSRQEEQLRAEAQLNRQRIIIGAAFLIIILVFILLLAQRNKANERKKNNELLVRKNQIIEEKAKKLDESNSIKNRLFSIIAHDLRNPLSSFQGVIQLLEMNAASKEDLETVLPYVANKFENTSILLTNLLEWSMSQMEGYQILAEPFDLNQLAREKFELITSKAIDKELEVYLPQDPIMVLADKNMIGIVILNMLSNAVKFTEPKGTIRLEYSEKSDEMIISISDTGKGISKDKLPQILDDEFYSTDGTSGEKGTGLGLILCKEFIQKNNGTLSIKSEPGKGTTVSFTLPVAREEVLKLSVN